MVAKRKKTSQKSKREKEKNNGLNKHFFSKIKQEYHDIDYADKLPPKAKAYLSKFMNEHVGANLSGKNTLHDTPEMKKEVFDANNARNRDIWSIHKAIGRISYYTSGEDALKFWEEITADHIAFDEEAWMKPQTEDYQDAVVMLFYNRVTDELFSVQYNDEQQGYLVIYDNSTELIKDRKRYVELVTNPDVIKIDEN